MRRTMAAALLALAWTADARAAAPQVDPASAPAISVTAGDFAYSGVHPADGDTFTVSRGSWSGTGNSYSYQWQRCPGGTSCVDVPGATSASLKADTLFGSGLRAVVTASNADGSTTYRTPVTRPLADEIPHLIDPAHPAAIEGVLEEGSTLTLAPKPLYAGSRPFSVQITWQRCDQRGDCRDITESDRSYVPVPADVGHYLRARFYMVNGAGHYNLGLTAQVGPVTVNTRPPSRVSAPTVSALDGPVEGSVLQATAGTWSGGRPIATAFQWLRCDGEACADLPGETTSRYTAVAADVGRRLKVRVTATSQYGSASAESAVSSVVGAAPPSVGAVPVVSGTAKDGQVLAGSRGTFTGTAPMEEAAGWERCDAEGLGCIVIAGATSDAYTLVPDDIGHRLRFRVLASNDGGTAVGRSAPTPVVQAIAPAASEMPIVTGVARDEQILEGTLGAWTGSPTITYARQWMRCSDAGCSPIAGATGASHAITAADVGSRLRLRVTASNFGNAVEALSPPTAVVEPSAPRSVEAPSIAGAARDGAVLTASLGSWKGTGPLAHGLRWERCDGGCTPIAGATDASYRLTSADVGRRVRVLVTAAGPGGSAEAASVATDPVAAVAPVAGSAPEVIGTARDGSTLAAAAGTWTGSAPLTVTRRWERCDPECAPIAAADAAAYELEPADVGARVRVVERAVNAAGATEAASAQSAVVAAAAPRSTGAPAIGGVARDGETLEASRGEWEGTPELTFARQWLRCSSAADEGSCEAVPGAAGASHVLGADDVGSFLRVRVTATNPAGSAPVLSDAAGPVTAAAPRSTPGSGPVLIIPGDPDQSAPDVGDRVVVEPGSWAGTARDLVFAYRWERCDTSGCQTIAGRTGGAETVTADDTGRQLRVVVTATNAAGSASQATPRLGVTRGAVPTPAAEAVPAPATISPQSPVAGALGPDACQVVAARRILRAGGVKLTVPAGTASTAQPLVATLTGRAKRVTLRAGARRVRLATLRRGRQVALLKPAVLAKARLIQLAVMPRRGRPAKVSARLALKPCQALLTVRLGGDRLTLRVDQRTPIGRVTFTLPRGLAIRPATARPAGGLVLAGRRLTIPSGPPATSTATLTVRLAGRPRRGRALRFTATTDTARLASTASVRR